MLMISILGPAVSAFSCFFFSRWIGSNILRLVLFVYVLSSIASITLLYYTVVNDLNLMISFSQWSTYLAVNFEVTIDILNASLLSVVVVIGTCVISYTNYYMATDAHLYRFVGLLSSFVSFMVILAISSNLVVLFIGWELIGLFSYLLIGFWSDRNEASNAALSAMLTNKFGDYLLSLGLILTFSQISSLDVLSLNTIYSYFNTNNTNYLIGLISICYLIAAMAKSAQIGLHLWLVHAMQEGTTRKNKGEKVLLKRLTDNEITEKYGLINHYNFTKHNNLNLDQKRIGSIMGCMLGDGHIRPGSMTKNGINQGHARYAMTMGVAGFDYVEDLKTTVFDIFGLSVTAYYPNTSLEQNKHKMIKQCTFSTKSSMYFTQLHHIWYRWDGQQNKFVKQIPLELEKWFTVETILHWVIQDGSFGGNSTLFCTECFTKEECIFLQRLLLRFNLETRLTIRKKIHYRIKILKTSQPQLIKLIKDNMPIEYKYKLGPISS